jgi:hypothetical protein
VRANPVDEPLERYATHRDLLHELTPVRVQEILLVAPAFDAFALEQDGLLNELLFDAYYPLMLTSPPRVTKVSTHAEAVALGAARRFDLVVLVSRLGQGGHLEFSAALRSVSPGTPIFLLLNDNVEVGATDERRAELLRHFDHIFVWNGNPDIFLAMVQLLENRANVENDTHVGLTRVILLVEDSIRYYSRYLPILYGEILKQTVRLARDQGVDGMSRTLTMRVRPKVLLATTYEEAIALAERFHDYLLCLITDRKFPKDGVMDSQAGLKLIQSVRARAPHLPMLLQSSDPVKAAWAEEEGATFLNKNSYTLGAELSRFFHDRLGFGDFVFRDATGAPIDRASDLKEMQARLRTVPDATLIFHGSRDHFSAWIMARGEVQAARVLARFRVTEATDPAELRSFLISVGRQVQRLKNVGAVVNLTESTPPDEPNILRLASGAMGGKARGVAFMHGMLSRMDPDSISRYANIRIPRSAIVGTDAFVAFVERHGLRALLEEGPPDEVVRARFLSGELPETLLRRLRLLLALLDGAPLAVRSSGILEDSLSHPFAGLYETFFLPNNHPDPDVRLAQLAQAIRLVWASVYTRAARNYFEAIDYKVEEEQMAVLVQEMCGSRHGDRFYPHVSGVAQSCNDYPVAYLKPDDGIANVAVGLGAYVVGGGRAYRFAPAYPQLDILPPRLQAEASQREFLALDLSTPDVDLTGGSGATLRTLPVAQAEADGALRHLASVWDANDDRIRDGLDQPGLRIVNFRNVLKYDQFPLAPILQHLLRVLPDATQTPVELEFAVNLDKDPHNGRPTFYLLQIKHQRRDGSDVHLPEELDPDVVFLRSERCVGNGVVDGLCDIVWVDPDVFDPFGTVAIAEQLDALNARFLAEGRRMLLVGPGRWGSSDRFLGIPVAWPMISAARVIVEYATPTFQADPSLGSHFFHNVTSLNIGYLTVPWPRGNALLDWEWLRAQPVVAREGALVHTRVPVPLRVVMDGRRGVSVVLKEPPLDNEGALP